MEAALMVLLLLADPIQREPFRHMCRVLCYRFALLMPVVSLHPSGESSINMISSFP